MDYHHFNIMYYRAPAGDWAYVDANPFLLAGDQATSPSHSAEFEQIAFSIEPLSTAGL